MGIQLVLSGHERNQVAHFNLKLIPYSIKIGAIQQVKWCEQECRLASQFMRGQRHPNADLLEEETKFIFHT